MAKTIWHTMMSLDGFIAGPDGEMEWAFEHGGRSGLADNARDTTGAILAGRRWYDAASRRYDGVAGIYGGCWSGPVFVLTHRAEELAGDPTVIALSGPIEDALAATADASGGLAVGVFGAAIARQCLDAGLLDEIVVHVAPVLLGDGVRFYGSPEAGRVDLERLEAGGSEQVTDLRFRVRRQAAGASG